MAVIAEPAFAVGAVFTVTNLLAVAVAPHEAVTVTVYVVLVVGLKVAAAFVPPLLLHEYVPPPLAVNVTLWPLQIVAVAGEIEADGAEQTV